MHGRRSEILERAADRIGEVRRRFWRVITGGPLGVDLHMSVGWHQFPGNWNPLYDLDALRHQRVIFHVAHGHEAIKPPHAEPMDRIGHQLLESGILYPGNTFGALKIGRGLITAFLTLARVIDQKLGDLAERAPFLAIVDDDAEAAGLSRA